MSNNSGPVDFPIRPVRCILKFLTGKWCLSGNSNHRGTVIKPAHQKIFFFVLVEMTFELVHAYYNLPESPFLCTLHYHPGLLLSTVWCEKRFRCICCCCRFELALQQNEILDVFYDDYLSLADDETTFGAKSDNYLKVMWYIMNYKTKPIKSYNFTC